MLLSTQTEVLGERYGDAQAIKMLADVGFDAFDLSLFRMFSQKDYGMNGPNFRDYAKSLREAAEKSGIVCNQAHAPFASSTGEAARDEEIFEAIVRAMEGAAIVGAKIIIVHPKQHLPYITNAAELKRLNMEFYGRLIPYCEQFGIKVACENMWQYSEKTRSIIDSVCSRPDEFCDYLDTLASPWIVGCLDLGHTVLTDEDTAHCIRTMGKTRLRALHVHDNDLISDSHALPFTMRMDFPSITKALAEIGYEGDFTFEADHFLRLMPKEVEKDALRLMHSVGRYLVGQIEEQG